MKSDCALAGIFLGQDILMQKSSWFRVFSAYLTITNSFLQQEYPTYTILGQSQYQSCYPSSGFGVVPPTDSSTESLALATTTYPEEKPNTLVPSRAVQRPSSGEAWSVDPLC